MPTTHKLALMTAAALQEANGQDIIIFDARGSGAGTDFYLLVTALATPHIKALHTAGRLALKSVGVTCYRKSGAPETGWVVADYLDFIIHFFDADTRAYYKLEQLWEKLPRVDISLD